jgi:hypothetical protein
MVITYSKVNKIKFPVYVIPSGNWEKTDGLLFLEGELVDDKNMPGATLGIRRMQTPHKFAYWYFKAKNKNFYR